MSDSGRILGDCRHHSGVGAKCDGCKLADAEARIATLEAALSPNSETKAAYSGEFAFATNRYDSKGNEYTEMVVVPWTTIKEIMAAILNRAALTDAPDAGRVTGEEMRERAADVCKRMGDAAMLSRFVCHSESERRKLEGNAALCDTLKKEIEAIPLTQESPDAK